MSKTAKPTVVPITLDTTTAARLEWLCDELGGSPQDVVRSAISACAESHIALILLETFGPEAQQFARPILEAITPDVPDLLTMTPKGNA